MSGRWVFGYGSLVSPLSFGHTLGRDLQPGIDFFEAEVAGYGRRWNYGTGFEFTAPAEPGGTPTDWTFVALGVVVSATETTNGVVGWVNDPELAELDLRERQYDRVDVTSAVTFGDDAARTAVGDAPVVIYVPRVEPIRIYEAARRARRRGDHEAVLGSRRRAFADLGPDRRERYHATTPAPDIPIVAMAPERCRSVTAVGRTEAGTRSTSNGRSLIGFPGCRTSRSPTRRQSTGRPADR